MKLNGLFKGIDISTTGLSSYRKAMELISENIANVNTTRTKNGGPYQRQTPVFNERNRPGSFGDLLNSVTTNLEATEPNHFPKRSTLLTAPDRSVDGVACKAVRPAQEEYRLVYEPNHPDADAQGYVRYPKINMLEEMVALMQLSRSYEANVTAMQAAKAISKKALEV
ncbi:MAG: flagellar basal body rod protein FlgC [Calditrichota bacterium]